jgi:DNA topoisomerase I
VLTRVFPDLFDVDFTSGMEAQLDRIEEGEIDWRKLLAEFYTPFQAQLVDGAARSQRIVRESIAPDTPPCAICGREMQVKWNRFGRFLGCTGYPECRHTESIDGREKAEPIPTGESCPNCQSPMVEREGRFGPFIACSNYPTCKHTQPKTIPGMTCPQCNQGAVGEKRTRKGKPFWGCVRYPDCDWSTWDPPVPQACSCGATFLVRKNTKAKGDFLKCLTCKSEYTQEGDGNVEAASQAVRTPAQRRAAAAEEGNGRAGGRRFGGRSGARKGTAKSAAGRSAAGSSVASKGTATKSVAKKSAAKKGAAKKGAARKSAARKGATKGAAGASRRAPTGGTKQE